MFTKADILQIAKAQFALDFNCDPADFDKDQNTLVENQLREGRRVNTQAGCFLRLLCFNGRAIISADPALLPWCAEHLLKASAAWLFEYPRLRSIDGKLREFGYQIADAHHFYLPHPARAADDPGLRVQWFEGEEIQAFRGDRRFGEALAFDKNHPDALAVAALDGEQIMGMAGASADGPCMWQIGIDVIPAYRGKGLGTRLVRLLKDEVLRRGKVPFYGTVESHFFSQNIAINAGFYPAWAELYTGRLPEGPAPA